MEYANVSVRFPKELDRELERFLDETGVYTNKSEFIKESVRQHLTELHDDSAIAALRVEQMLARAEQNPITDEELHGRLTALQESVDDDAVAEAAETAREETADDFLDQS